MEELQRIVDEQNKQLQEMNAQLLLLVEAIALVLYTGPMFEKYNAACRGGSLATEANQPDFMRANFEKHCKGNRYPTTLHLISSGIMKLGKLTTVGYGVEINSL